MKNWNSMEYRLRSWQPRRPSPRVEQNIFAPAHSSRRASWLHRVHFHLSWQSGWAAGIATCLVLAFTLLNFSHSTGVVWLPKLNTSAVLSNSSYASSFVELEHNCVSAPIFGWTNDRELHSSVGSFDLLKTNHLLP
jgi:hypothetical protein